MMTVAVMAVMAVKARWKGKTTQAEVTVRGNGMEMEMPKWNVDVRGTKHDQRCQLRYSSTSTSQISNPSLPAVQV
jgi:hypothetical protein